MAPNAELALLSRLPPRNADMSQKLDTLLPTAYQNFLLAVLAGLAYYLAFLLNTSLGSAILYDNWIALIFIPAGIKHLFILVARGWGALGCFVGLLAPSLQYWSHTPIYQVVLYSGLSTLSSWLGLMLGMRWIGVRRDLQNLRFLHLPVLDLVTTAVHGFVVSLYFIAVGMTTDHLLGSALAFMLGDYTGSFLVLTCLWLALTWMRRKDPINNVKNL